MYRCMVWPDFHKVLHIYSIRKSFYIRVKLYIPYIEPNKLYIFYKFMYSMYGFSKLFHICLFWEKFMENPQTLHFFKKYKKVCMVWAFYRTWFQTLHSTIHTLFWPVIKTVIILSYPTLKSGRWTRWNERLRWWKFRMIWSTDPCQFCRTPRMLWY